MLKMLAGLILSLTICLPSWAQRAEKKAVGMELVAPSTPYSPGVLVGDTLYISGLQGTDPHTHQLPGDFSHELRDCIDNVGRVLSDAGMDYSNVV